MAGVLKEFTYKNILWIAIESDTDADALVTLSEEDALRNGEEAVQLKEGCSYEYEFLDTNCKFAPLPGIIHQSRKHPFRGRLTPGNYVGRLPLIIVNGLDRIECAVEIRSSKAHYRSEYRKMLEDITAECTELLMLHSSPVTQRYAVDFGTDSQSLYQRFSFVKAMVDSDDFNNAVLRVMNAPITRWSSERECVDSRRIKKIGSCHAKQFASGGNRIALPATHVLGTTIHSIPRRLSSMVKTDTLDNPENRFIKHALAEFARFAAAIQQKIEQFSKGPKPTIYFEAKQLEAKLAQWLSHNTFREVSQVTALPLNNPVLQRKEGYREIFKVWLMYDLAAKLTWKGLESDTYSTGKRNVATLYEYWLFFKLLRMVEEIFTVKSIETSQLIEQTSDGLGLQLQTGKHTAIEGSSVHNSRTIKIKYNYNRTFSYADFPKSGSWTQNMRPDYTLSFWPADFSEHEAEELESIVHIHFDAKYKVDDLKYMLTSESPDGVDGAIEALNHEKELEKSGTYKRADLLKMHAYKDAIRRTAGAYVLYPGTQNSKPYKGFHELIPGLGAFAVSPSLCGDAMGEVKKFILNVLDHFTDRNTQREAHSFYMQQVMRNPGRNRMHERIPEYVGVGGKKMRTKPASEISVLIAFVKEKQKSWVLQNGFYNIRIDKQITPAIAGADYLLLYDAIDDNKLRWWSNGLFVIKASPQIQSKQWLLQRGYPMPGQQEYFLYTISTVVEHWSENKIAEIALGNHEEPYRPFTRVLPQLLKPGYAGELVAKQ